MRTIKERAIKWYQDRKLMIAFIIIILSFVLGFYGKALIIIKFYQPIYVITGISIFAFSWVMLFVGIFMVGWSTVKRMQEEINQNVKIAAKKTYYQAKYQATNIPRNATKITIGMHRKSVDKIKSTSKAIVKKIRRND